MINFLKRFFKDVKAKENEESRYIDEILSHNRNTINIDRKSKKSEEKGKQKEKIEYYKESINSTIALDDEEYFLKLKKIEDKKKCFENNRKKRQREFHQKNKLKGIEFELKTGKIYERKGYHVLYNGIENGKRDKGIDLICVNENEVLLIQCKNYTKEKSINHVKIKEFHSNAMIHIEKHGINKNQVKLKYAVPCKKVFDNSAIKIFRDDIYNCRYEII